MNQKICDRCYNAADYLTRVRTATAFVNICPTCETKDVVRKSEPPAFSIKKFRPKFIR